MRTCCAVPIQSCKIQSCKTLFARHGIEKTIVVEGARIPCIQFRPDQKRSFVSNTITTSVVLTLCPVVSIKLIIKIDITHDGFLAFLRAGYGFVLEPVEIYFLF